MTELLRRKGRWMARCLAAAAAGGLAAGPVQAFFFKGWPGDGLPKPRTLLPGNAPKEGNPPSAQVREERPPPGGPDDVVKDKQERPTEVPPEGPPEQPPPIVPEPTTIALAGVGIGAVVLARLRRVGRAAPRG